MENPLKKEIDEITEGLRRNPAHILRWVEKENELKKNPELFLKHKRFFDENFAFKPDEDIMVYADFFYPTPPTPGEPAEFSEPTLHSHEFFELFYLYSGKCECIYEDRALPLKPGSVCVLNTRCRHRIHHMSHDSLVYNIMLRRKTMLSDMLTMLGENDLFFNFFIESIHGDATRPSIMLFDLEPGENAETYVFNIIKEYYSGEANSQSLMKLLYAALLIELSRKYKSGCMPDSSDFMRIMSYISDNWSTVTLSDICREFRVSQSTLSRLFRGRTGADFSDYIRRFRMDKAKRFLTQTELGIEKIAELCGYSQRSSFDKEFKKYAGQTPAHFRKNGLNPQK